MVEEGWVAGPTRNPDRPAAILKLTAGNTNEQGLFAWAGPVKPGRQAPHTLAEVVHVFLLYTVPQLSVFGASEQLLATTHVCVRFALHISL